MQRAKDKSKCSGYGSDLKWNKHMQYIVEKASKY
jgi:hypothetical protein